MDKPRNTVCLRNGYDSPWGMGVYVARAPKIAAAKDTPLGTINVIACDPATARQEGIFFAEFLLQHTAETFCRALVERLQELVHDKGGA